MCAGHEVCAEQREAYGVSALGGELQALLEHFFKGAAVEAAEMEEEAVKKEGVLKPATQRMTHQKIDRSDVSTSISTRESTILVWKMMVFIIFPSSLWSEIPRLALETLVYAFSNAQEETENQSGHTGKEKQAFIWL